VPILGQGGPGDRRSIELYTRARNRIAIEQLLPRAPEAMKAAADLWTKAYPNLRVRSLDSTYNCVGLVFASRRAAVDPDQLPRIFEDDSYARLSSRGEAAPGDVAVYRDTSGAITHVGIIIAIEKDIRAGILRFQILSQWGRDGEYLHDGEDVPAPLGRLTDVWSERKGT
jgi:hypothetical protein